MAVKLADVVEEMKGVLSSDSEPGHRCDRILELAADFLVAALARDRERGQVTVLMVVPDHQQLTFAYPPRAATSCRSTAKASPAGRCSRSGR